MLKRGNYPLIFISFVFFSLFLFPGDQAVEKAAGGILPKGEPHVSTEKVRLFISPGKVSAEYAFENKSSEDIITQIVFPVPEFEYPWETRPADFSDFKLWIDGSTTAYKTEVRAFLKGKDRTEILRSFGITVETFGGFDHSDSEPRNGVEYFRRYEINALSQAQKAALAKIGLIEGSKKAAYLAPLWSVRKLYSWTQRFPAAKVVVIRHEYSPVVGDKYLAVKNLRREFKDLCLTEEFLGKMSRDESLDRNWTGYVGWVKYILTTAKTWKTPIKDFELVVENAPLPSYWPRPKYMTFCWNGKAQVADRERLSVQAVNFIPKKDLTVYFFW